MFTQNLANIQMHSPMAIATTQEPTTTATNYNHNHRILQQIPNPKTSTKKKKKKTQNLQQNPNPTDQSTTKLNNYQRQKLWRMMSKDRRLPLASRASDRRAELQIGELQSASSTSNQNRLLLRDRKRKRER